MLTTLSTAVALSALTLVSAQANSNSTFKIDPNSVTISDRVTWCQGEQDSCGTVCGQPISNDCNTNTLDFTCVCQGNNAPDMNVFMNAMPWFVCEQLQSNCITQTENNAAGQKNCTETFGSKCGTEAVADHAGEGAVTSTTSSSATPSGTATAASSSVASTSSSHGAAVPTNVQHLGNGAAAVAVGFMATGVQPKCYCGYRSFLVQFDISRIPPIPPGMDTVMLHVTTLIHEETIRALMIWHTLRESNVEAESLRVW
ncbi:hypothetical protein GGR54DRAFT_649973 [Hypoxylon sp. NC1633]|nr:hypothetical protein GGR54DRAFT_649973 [Hypoxylon sp. NC1633]